jgi:hypothetical protein
MSTWTHVAATIRFDALRLPGMPDQRPDLGKTCDFDSPDHEWKACSVPRGSEGSLQVHLWENPHKTHIAAYTATIWGDLRDYESVDEVLEYLDRITAGRLVRQGVAEIAVEYSDAVIVRFDGEARKWQRLPPCAQDTTGADQ